MRRPISIATDHRELARPRNENDWRQQYCQQCGHEWACRLGTGWFCARCDWPPTVTLEAKAGAVAVDAFKAHLREWIAQQETLRSGTGSWAKAQRSMLDNLRRFIDTA